MADTNELIDVCTDLIRLVEGVGCKDWRDQNGQRFKDTNEWVRAYVAINNARKESREQSTTPADVAKDAARYRFLRECVSNTDTPQFLVLDELMGQIDELKGSKYSDALDAAIDAAILSSTEGRSNE